MTAQIDVLADEEKRLKNGHQWKSHKYWQNIAHGTLQENSVLITDI